MAATYPTGILTSIYDGLSAGTIAALATNDATRGHATGHVEHAEEIVALQTLLGTNASQTTPTGTNRILASSSASASTWTGTPTITTLTTTGAITIANDAALTLAHTGATSSTLKQDTNNDVVLTIGTAAKLFEVKNSAAATVFEVNTSAQVVNTSAGYKLQAYDSTNVDYTEINHNGTDALITNNAGRFLVDPAGNEFSPHADNDVQLGASGLRWTEVFAVAGAINTSDRRDKKHIKDSDLGLEFIKKLRPVQYQWKLPGHEGNYYGLIADEVSEILPDNAAMVVVPENKEHSMGLRYTELIAPMIKAIQELSAEVQALKAK